VYIQFEKKNQNSNRFNIINGKFEGGVFGESHCICIPYINEYVGKALLRIAQVDVGQLLHSIYTYMMVNTL